MASMLKPLTLGSTRPLTPTGKLVRLVAVGALAGGAFVGFLMPATSIGVEGTSPEELATPRQVDCGSALAPKFNSLLCQEALSGRKTVSVVLLVSGGVLLLGASQMREPEDP